MARPPRFGGRLRIAHLRVVRHSAAGASTASEELSVFRRRRPRPPCSFSRSRRIWTPRHPDLLVLAILLVALSPRPRRTRSSGPRPFRGNRAGRGRHRRTGAGRRPRVRDGRDRGRRVPRSAAATGRRACAPPPAAFAGQRSRTIMASASSIGASARTVISSYLPRWKRSSSIAARFFATPPSARADRLDARLLDRFEHGASLLAAGRELAMHRRVWQASRNAIDRHGRARFRPRAR